MNILDNYQCFLILGIEDYGESNCDHVELLTLAKSAIPKGYTRNVFCAYSSVGEEATCRGDSGKYVMCELLLINAQLYPVTNFMGKEMQFIKMGNLKKYRIKNI